MRCNFKTNQAMLRSHIADAYRRSHQTCFVEKGVLRNFAKFTGKHLCQSLIFNKVAGAACKFIKKETGAGVFL